MFSCRTLTFSAKVSCRTLEIAEPKALSLEKDHLAEPWNGGSFRICPQKGMAPETFLTRYEKRFEKSIQIDPRNTRNVDPEVLQSGFGLNSWIGLANFRKINGEFLGEFPQRISFFLSCFSKVSGPQKIHAQNHRHSSPIPIRLDARGAGQWKWMEEVPSRTSLATLTSPCFVLCLRG